jgi:tRNA threonylcarbamoyladenosine biosynthesis protein TsaE
VHWAHPTYRQLLRRLDPLLEEGSTSCLLQLSCVEKTQEIGLFLGKILQELFPREKAAAVIALKGDMGAGKTTLVKSLAQGLGLDPAQVQSPTFTYLQPHGSPPFLFHFDLYRLKSAQDFFTMGFDETFYQNGVVCIEWAERLENLLPPYYLQAKLEHIATPGQAPGRQLTLTIAQGDLC